MHTKGLVHTRLLVPLSSTLHHPLPPPSTGPASSADALTSLRQELLQLCSVFFHHRLGFLSRQTEKGSLNLCLELFFASVTCSAPSNTTRKPSRDQSPGSATNRPCNLGRAFPLSLGLSCHICKTRGMELTGLRGPFSNITCSSGLNTKQRREDSSEMVDPGLGLPLPGVPAGRAVTSLSRHAQARTPVWKTPSVTPWEHPRVLSSRDSQPRQIKPRHGGARGVGSPAKLY